MQQRTIRRAASASPPTSARAIGPPCAAWRQATIGAIKLLHSAIFLVNSASVLHICWIGLSGRRSRWTRLTLVAALGETAVFVADRGRCPLTGLAERLGAESGRVSTIFLPRWFADHIPLIFGPPLGIGLLLLAWRSRSAPPRAGAEHLAEGCAPLDSRAALEEHVYA